MRFNTESAVCESVVDERLEDSFEDVPLFDVPNPESDIDPSVSDLDRREVFINYIGKLRASATAIRSASVK